MKKARLILSASMIALMGIAALSLTSCSNNDTDCAPGMTGKDCGTEIRTPMIGTYDAIDVNDNNSSETYSYTATISKNSTVTVVNISNLSAGFFNGVVTSSIKQDGDNISFTIPNQKPDGGTYNVSGSGTYDSNNGTISIHYTIANDTASKTYSGTWTKH